MTTPLPIFSTEETLSDLAPPPPIPDNTRASRPVSRRKVSRSQSIGSSPSKKKMKKFTFEEIEKKVRERKNTIPEYRNILMQCAVEEDDDGVWFDLKHPSWEQLVQLVKSRSSNNPPRRSKRNAPAQRPPQPPKKQLNHIEPDREFVEERERPQHPAKSAMETATHRSRKQPKNSAPPPPSALQSDSNRIAIRRKSKKIIKEKSDQEWHDILMEQLSSFTPNQRSVRDACRVVQIPPQLRAQIWKILLGAHRRKIEILNRSSSARVARIAQSEAATPETPGHDDEDDETTTAAQAPPSATSSTSSNTSTTTTKDVPTSNPPPAPTSSKKKNKKSRKKKRFSLTGGSSSADAANGDQETPAAPVQMEWRPLPTYPPSPLPNQRTIVADIERTRPNLVVFQDEFNQQKMEIILTEYCRRKNVSYKQGMNYVLAPFFLVDMKDITDIYLSFEMFIDKFLKSTFVDDEFGSLQCIFRLTNILLSYHDPELAYYFKYEMDPPLIPELYATGWFTTLHANKVDPDTLVWLWDRILLHDYGTCIGYFIAIELLRLHRDQILDKSYDVLLPFLSNMVIEDRDEARRLITNAEKSIASTPLSFYNLLHKCSSMSVMQDTPLYDNIQNMSCMYITPLELIAHVTNNMEHLYGSSWSQSTMILNEYDHTNTRTPAPHHGFMSKMRKKRGGKRRKGSTDGDAASNAPNGPFAMSAPDLMENTFTGFSGHGAPKYFVLDCREHDQYNHGHLPCCFHLDPTLSYEELEEQIIDFTSWKSCHFCLLFDGLESPQYDELKKFIVHKFLEKKCKFVSICDGGYHACHQFLESSQPTTTPGGDDDHSNDDPSHHNSQVDFLRIEFVDHNPRHCIECNGSWKKILHENKKIRARAERAAAKAAKAANHQDDDGMAVEDSSLFSSMKGKFATFVSEATKLRNANSGNNNAIDESTGLPLSWGRNVNVLSNSMHLRVLMTLVRDRNTESEQFRSVSHVILHLLFGDLFEHLRFNEVKISTPYDIETQGYRCERNIYGVTLNDEQSCRALKEVLFTYFPCLNAVIDQIEIEETFVHDDEDGVLRSTRKITLSSTPHDIKKRIVIVFVPVLTLASEVATAITTLSEHGARMECTVIVTLVASRNAISYIVEHFQQVHIWCACVDDVESSRISPGIGTFKHRYRNMMPGMMVSNNHETRANGTGISQNDRDDERSEGEEEKNDEDVGIPTDVNENESVSRNLDDVDVASVESVEDDGDD